ncbi:hypothetical protein NC653_040546 [Populus alba x Populus x berolinensis]|uniref:BED-type domain-containing protein n=1 Tax=Populus alba x Populus x berolinensis TaxID=444605 RepID=A0AAD6PN61_9ROSI|nr:uncharacterized protein LOC118039820 [Populus alba]KAJ6951192.1 hypothetical protein NC653_040546 [Populus alba x Populus x berolinensis]
MIRPHDQVRDQVDKTFWAYVEKIDDGRMGCKFCGHLFAQDTTISRIKCHFSGLKGRGVKVCEDVTEEVQDAAREAIEGPPEKKLLDAGESSRPGARTMKTMLLRIVFDQLGYASIGMVLAFVALLLATSELIYMTRKEIMSLLPCFHRRSTSTFAPGKPVGTIVEYFGLVGAVWQCFYSTVEYAYARQNKDNPIKMCLLPFLFLLCVVFSKLMKNSFIDKIA